MEEMLESARSRAIPQLNHVPYPLKEPVSTGTTLISCKYDGGVVVGTDSRTSAGSFIASRVTDKITPVTDHIVILRSGSAADTQAIADIVKYYTEVYTYTEREPLSVYRVAQLLRSFLYEYRDSLSASMIVAGWDEVRGPQIYTIPLGGFTNPQEFTASGSGSTFVMGYMDKHWREGMSLAEVCELVRNSVALAMHRDGSSGGVIRLAVVDKSGTRRELITPAAPDFPALMEPKRELSHLPPHIAKRQEERMSLAEAAMQQ